MVSHHYLSRKQSTDYLSPAITVGASRLTPLLRSAVSAKRRGSHFWHPPTDSVGGFLSSRSGFSVSTVQILTQLKVMPPTEVRPQTFAVFQQPDSDSPSVQSRERLNTCCLDILPVRAFPSRTTYIQLSRCIVPTAWCSLFSTRLLSHTLEPKFSRWKSWRSPAFCSIRSFKNKHGVHCINDYI